MRPVMIFVAGAALILTACYSPTINTPKAEEDPFAGPESEPGSAPVRDTAPPPPDQSAPDMDAINAVADRLTRDAEKNCNNAQYAGPREIASVDIVFMPNGRTEEVKLVAPHASTPIGDCIKQTYKSGIVPPFKGEPVTIERKVDFTKKAEPAKKEPEKK